MVSSVYHSYFLKKSLQFSVLVALFYFYTGSFNLANYFTGLIGFLLTYNFVYVLTTQPTMMKTERSKENFS